MMKVLTYGMLPTWEAFDKAFRLVCPDGSYEITNDPLIGSDRFNSVGLWNLLQTLIIGWNDGDDEQGDLASAILLTLGFEWI